MTDTPQHIKDLQLKLWLAKEPEEKLRQLMIDNDALYKFWDEVRANYKNDINDINKVIISNEIIGSKILNK